MCKTCLRLLLLQVHPQVHCMNGSSDGSAHIHNIKLLIITNYTFSIIFVGFNEYVSLVFQDPTAVPSQHWSQDPNCISLSTGCQKGIPVTKSGQSWHIPNSKMYFSHDGQIPLP